MKLLDISCSKTIVLLLQIGWVDCRPVPVPRPVDPVTMATTAATTAASATATAVSGGGSPQIPWQNTVPTLMAGLISGSTISLSMMLFNPHAKYEAKIMAQNAMDRVRNGASWATRGYIAPAAPRNPIDTCTDCGAAVCRQCRAEHNTNAHAPNQIWNPGKANPNLPDSGHHMSEAQIKYNAHEQTQAEKKAKNEDDKATKKAAKEGLPPPVSSTTSTTYYKNSGKKAAGQDQNAKPSGSGLTSEQKKADTATTPATNLLRGDSVAGKANPSIANAVAGSSSQKNQKPGEVATDVATQPNNGKQRQHSISASPTTISRPTTPTLGKKNGLSLSTENLAKFNGKGSPQNSPQVSPKTSEPLKKPSLTLETPNSPVSKQSSTLESPKVNKNTGEKLPEVKKAGAGGSGGSSPNVGSSKSPVESGNARPGIRRANSDLGALTKHEKDKVNSRPSSLQSMKIQPISPSNAAGNKKPVISGTPKPTAQPSNAAGNNKPVISGTPKPTAQPAKKSHLSSLFNRGKKKDAPATSDSAAPAKQSKSGGFLNRLIGGKKDKGKGPAVGGTPATASEKKPSKLSLGSLFKSSKNSNTSPSKPAVTSTKAASTSATNSKPNNPPAQDANTLKKKQKQKS